VEAGFGVANENSVYVSEADEIRPRGALSAPRAASDWDVARRYADPTTSVFLPSSAWCASRPQ
jgi:hypothetical protein